MVRLFELEGSPSDMRFWSVAGSCSAMAGLGADGFGPGMTLGSSRRSRLNKNKATTASTANPTAPPTTPAVER